MARIIEPFKKFFTKDGSAPLSNGYLYFYQSGTTTPKSTYSDSNLTLLNTNPLPLTTEGWAGDVFAQGSFRVDSYDNLIGLGGTLQQSFDPVGGNFGLSPFDNWDINGSYDIGDIVIGSDLNYYRSITNSNVGNDPTTDTTNWERFYAGAIEWNSKNTTYTTLGHSEEYIDADTSSTIWTLTLKTSPADGDIVGVRDQEGTFSTNNLTITDADGNDIANDSGDFICDVDNLTVYFQWDDTNSNWRVF